MINSFRINENVASVMKKMGVGRKPIIESEEEHPADEKSARTEIPYKKGHYQFTFKTSKGKDGKWIRRIYKGEDMNAIHDKAKAKALKDYPESYGHVCHSPQCDESIKAGEQRLIEEGEEGAKHSDTKDVHIDHIKAGDLVVHGGKVKTVSGKDIKRDPAMGKTLFGDSYKLGKQPVKKVTKYRQEAVKESDEAKEVGTEDQQFDAPTGKEIDDLNKKPEGVDQGHDEAGEEQDDPTREKLETPQDEADEQKGGAAELAADLRVSVRIERMNMGRYKKMLDKHDLSEDGQSWLKEKIQDIQDTIDDMLERIPKLEAEAKEQEGGEEEAKIEIQEHMRSKLRKAIVEIAG